jgi:hypothetical protein
MTGVDVAVRFRAPESVTCTAQSYLEKHGEPRTPHDLVHHELLLFRDPQTGRPFPWEFHRDGKVIQINAAGRLMMDAPSTGVAACIAGQAVYQSLRPASNPCSRRDSSYRFCPNCPRSGTRRLGAQIRFGSRAGRGRRAWALK